MYSVMSTTQLGLPEWQTYQDPAPKLQLLIVLTESHIICCWKNWYHQEIMYKTIFRNKSIYCKKGEAIQLLLACWQNQCWCLLRVKPTFRDNTENTIVLILPIKLKINSTVNTCLIFMIALFTQHDSLFCRLFVKQVEFEESVSTIAKRNEENSELLARISELEKEIAKHESTIRRYITIHC